MAMMQYKSQAGQDEWVLRCMDVITGRPGFFVDVGAYDGVEYSNTYALENLGWTGICIEPVEAYYDMLRRNRRCHALRVAVGDHLGTVEMEDRGMSSSVKEGGGFLVAMDTLKNILANYGAPPIIDYMSLDAEGMEPDVLAGFPFETHRCRLITAEHNLYLGDATNKNLIREVLTRNGYVCVQEDVEHNGYKFEDWYMHTVEHELFE